MIVWLSFRLLQPSDFIEQRWFKRIRRVIQIATNLTLDIPYRGLTEFSGLGFALDQFAHDQGFFSFAEWTASEFLKGHSISGIVKPVDDLDPMTSPEPGACATTFGYEVSIVTVAMRDDV